MDKDQRGFGFSLVSGACGLGSNAVSLQTLCASAGYSLDGFVDLGVGIGFVPTSGDNVGAGQYAFSAMGCFTVLKQDRMMPFSVTIPISVKKLVYTGASLDANGLAESGTGYTLGLDLFRYFRTDRRSYMRIGASMLIDMTMSTTEKLSGSSGGIYPIVKSEQVLRTGLIMGMSFRPNRANRGVAISMDIRPSVDTKLNIAISSAISLSLVETKLEKVQE